MAGILAKDIWRGTKLEKFPVNYNEGGGRGPEAEVGFI
jgi:hypothetical protein